MVTSILNSIKEALGVGTAASPFDGELTMHINTVLMRSFQLGVGETPFRITSDEEEWDDLLGDREDLEGIKTYVYLKVKLLFDPPQNSFLVEAIKNQIAELESCLNIQAEGESS